MFPESINDTLVACPGCGALVTDIACKPHPYIGASGGCWEVYGTVLAKEYGEYGYPEDVHRLTVDTYAVQHPGTPNLRAIQSVNSHLISLYLLLEGGVSGRLATYLLGNVLQFADVLTWLDPPVPNGSMTVNDVVIAQNFEEHKRLVNAWARDVWEAWTPHHARIKELAAMCRR